MNLIKYILPSILLLTLCKPKKETVRDLVDKGIDLINEKKFDKAIVLYSKAIKLNPKVQLAIYNRGIAYAEIKEYSKALSDFNNVIELQTTGVSFIDKDLNPTDEGQGQVSYTDAVYQRAVVKSYMDSLKSSFVDFGIAIENHYADSSNCLLWQGTLLGRGGQAAKACQYFERAKKCAPTLAKRQEAIDMIMKYCGQLNNNR